MIISVTDPTIKRAVIELQLKRNINLSNPAFLEAFKKEYHCNMIRSNDGYFSHIKIPNKKYATWFLLKFGDNNE